LDSRVEGSRISSLSASWSFTRVERWLWSEPRLGLIILLLGSLVAVVIPVVHMTGAGLGVRRSAGAFFFVWTLYALGVTGTFGFLLSTHALWRLRVVSRAPVP